MAGEVLSYPQCGRSDRLATSEHLVGFAPVVVTPTEHGTHLVEWTGETEVLGDDSHTTGVTCRACDWTYEGRDWSFKLSEESGGTDS